MDKNKAKIMVVDDVESNRVILKEIIDEMGYIPVLSESADQAKMIVDKINPQIILLDVAMPGMDGYEFCELLKKDPKTREIPIIFISAYNNQNEIVRCFNVGGEDFISKPFLHEEVKARIGMHLKLYESKRELNEVNRLLNVAVNEQALKIENEKKNVLYALLRVARTNAAYDENHMERLSGYCKRIAEAMELSPIFASQVNDQYINNIGLAAPVCDIGNMAVPASILQKKGKLTDEEMEIIRSHVTFGSKIIDDIRGTSGKNIFLDMSYDIVKYHHEFWNGTGYPGKIKENEIPLAAQIVSVASTYCALTESRTYREAFDKEQAVSIIEKDSGVKYNKDIVDILKRIYKHLD